MSIRKALEELLYIVEIHQKNTGNNFAWAEVEYAKELLAQPEPKQKPLSDEAICEILLKKEWKGFVELIRKIEELHGIGVEG